MPLPASGPAGSALAIETSSLNYINSVREARTANGPPTATYQNVQTAQPSKVAFLPWLD